MLDVPSWLEALIMLAVGGGGAGGLSYYGVRKMESKMVDKLSVMMEKIILPKLNTVCVRTSRMEVTESFIITVLEADGHEGLRDDICDEIDRLGIPRQDSPIKIH